MYGATLWGRTSIMMLAAFVALGSMVAAVATNVVGSTIVFQNSASQFSTSKIDGSDVGFGMTMMRRSDGAGGFVEIPVLRAGFADGRLDGLCVSTQQTVAGIPVTLRIEVGDGVLATTGDGGYDIVGRNAVFDITHMRATQIAGQPANGIQLDGRTILGLNTYDLTTVSHEGVPVDNPFGSVPGTGWFAVDADEGRIFSVRGTLWNAEIGGPFSMDNLAITVHAGSGHGCDDRPIPH